jgi:hypothetical protein
MTRTEKHALQREQCQKNILAVLDHDGIQSHRPFDVWRDRIFIPAVPDENGLPADIGRHNLGDDPIYHATSATTELSTTPKTARG